VQHSLHLDIAGMSCAHCVAAVEASLARLAGVEVRHITVGAADLSYDDSSISPPAIARAVKEAGYEVVSQRS